jgi:mannose-6-phosphate isomerase-like protein (cupin superfamily)
MRNHLTPMGAGAPRPGAVLEGPGKQLVFVALRADALVFEEEVEADAPPVPLHLHRRQSERFTVLDGVLDLTLAGELLHLKAGETALVPAGAVHTYANAGEDPVRIEVTLSPALEAHRFFESVYGMTRDGGLPPRGPRDALALAVLAHTHGFYLGALPLVVQRPLMAIGAALARLAGVRAWAPRYEARSPAVRPPAPGIPLCT